MNEEAVLKLHADSIVIDAVCPLAQPDSPYLDWYREGGVTALAPSIETDEIERTVSGIAAWHRLFREREDFLPVRRAADIELAKRTGRTGIYLHFQGTEPIGGDLDRVDFYKSLGIGIIQLAYNVKNRVGDGCEERTDSGLSKFGVKLIERLNRSKVIVDCSHTGPRTSLEAIEVSTAPVVLSHSNVKVVHESPRNVSDELLGAIATSGGIVGVVGFPGMVSRSKAPSLGEFVAHIDAIVQKVGIDYVGLGIDYYTLQAGVANDADATRSYEELVRKGVWSTAYPPPPHHYPQGIETPRTLQNLTRELVDRGYDELSIRKILGGNWMRVMKAVWG